MKQYTFAPQFKTNFKKMRMKTSLISMVIEVKNNVHSYYLHCNWGWGGTSNGYYLSDTFNTGDGPVYNDNATRSNYQYNLEFATFFK